jgi:hypothetical protein
MVAVATARVIVGTATASVEQQQNERRGAKINQEEEKIMATEKEAIEAMRRRLLDLRHQKEREIQELDAMYQTLGEAPRILEGKGTVERQERAPAKPVTRYNLNLSKQVDDYLAGYPWDEAINIKGMIKALKSEQGVQGKDDSLYAYIHSLLKKKSLEPGSALRYEKGVGYFKTRKIDKDDSVLVASV